MLQSFDYDDENFELYKNKPQVPKTSCNLVTTPPGKHISKLVQSIDSDDEDFESFKNKPQVRKTPCNPVTTSMVSDVCIDTKFEVGPNFLPFERRILNHLLHLKLYCFQ